jgi:hypothetical protein
VVVPFPEPLVPVQGGDSDSILIHNTDAMDEAIDEGALPLQTTTAGSLITFYCSVQPTLANTDVRPSQAVASGKPSNHTTPNGQWALRSPPSSSDLRPQDSLPRISPSFPRCRSFYQSSQEPSHPHPQATDHRSSFLHRRPYSSNFPRLPPPSGSVMMPKQGKVQREQKRIAPYRKPLPRHRHHVVPTERASHSSHRAYVQPHEHLCYDFIPSPNEPRVPSWRLSRSHLPQELPPLHAHDHLYPPHVPPPPPPSSSIITPERGRGQYEHKRTASYGRSPLPQGHWQWPQGHATPIDQKSAGDIPERSRRAAMSLVLSFFPLSSTKTIFSGPDISLPCSLPLSIPSSIRTYGWLKVPANTELRLRYWHLLDPAATIDDLLRRCIVKGLPYCILLPSSQGTFFRESSFVVDKAHPIVQAHKTVTLDMVQEYFRNVRRLLGQPDAHKFIEYGGLISRIVRHFAPGLSARAFDGPSLREGPTDIENTHYGHHITQAEIQTLLGFTSNNNTFWPHPHCYENSPKYNGEWTQANEAWFENHVNRISTCAASCIRSQTDWRRNIRPHNAEAGTSPTTIGTVAHAKACCTKLLHEHPDLWSAYNRFPCM